MRSNAPFFFIRITQLKPEACDSLKNVEYDPEILFTVILSKGAFCQRSVTKYMFQYFLTDQKEDEPMTLSYDFPKI